MDGEPVDPFTPSLVWQGDNVRIVAIGPDEHTLERRVGRDALGSDAWLPADDLPQIARQLMRGIVALATGETT